MKRNRILVLFFAFVILSSVVAQPVYAADNFFQKVSNSFTSTIRKIKFLLPGNKSGMDVMSESMRVAKDLKSSEIDFKVNVNLLKGSTSLAKLQMGLAGQYRVENPSDVKSLKSSLAFTGEASVEGTTLKATGDLKVMGEKVYVKLNELPALPNFDASAIKNTWFFTNSVADASSSASLSATDIQEVQEAAVKLFKSSQMSTAEKANKDGHAVYVVEAVIPKSAVSEYVNTVVRISGKNSTRITANADELKQSLDKSLESVGEIKAVFWVDQSSFFTRRVELPLVITLPASQASELQAAGSANPLAMLSQVDKIELSIVVTNDKFNQEFSFQEPTDAVDFSTMMTRMMGSQVPSSTMMKTGTSELPNMTAAQKKQLELYQKEAARQDINLNDVERMGY